MNTIQIKVSGKRNIGKSTVISLIRKHLKAMDLEVETKVKYKYQNEVYDEYENMDINKLKKDKFKVCIEEIMED